MDEQAYKASLETKTIEELTAELQTVQNNIETLLMMDNELDGTEIIEGGGDPADQERYQALKSQQLAITEEINKRHLLEMLK